MSYDNWVTRTPDDNPDGDFDDLDPDLFCLTHGKELPMGPYGVRYGGCEDCEGREVTFDEALGARCDEQRRMDEALRLKR
jgi:hypothetical protein